MRIFLLTMALAFTATSIAGETAQSEWFSKDREKVVVRAFYDNQQMLQNLADNAALWTVVQDKSYAIVEINEFEQVDLIKDGFRLELDESRTADLHRSYERSPDQRAGIDGFECYRTVEETFADAAQLAVDYPDLVEWLDVGDSWEKSTGLTTGHDMHVLKLTNANTSGDKPKLFVMSAIHAREYTTAETNTRFGEYLVNNYATNADARWLLDHHEIHLMLQANPDGRDEAQEGSSWRKNTNTNYCGPTSQNRGADLNRNFEFGWGCCGGSSGNQCNLTYRGAGPGSEPEVDAVQEYVRSIFPDQRGPSINDAAPEDATGVFIDVHSFSQLVLYPWGNTFDPAPNQQALRTLARKMAFFNGYEPQQATELYITDGTTDDFAYGDLGLASYTFELGTSFFQNCGTFESTIFPDNLQALIYSAKTVRAPYMLPSGPDVTNLAFSNNTVMPGVPANLSANVSDTRYENNNGTEPTQNIASVAAYVDVPPWEAGAVAIALDATDGAFNNSTEGVQGTIDTTGLPNGEHIVYLQGTDADGNKGVITAEFLYVIDPANAPVLSGSVTAADTGAGIAATVSAGSFSTTTDSNGAYQLLVFEGDYSITVTPTGNDYGATSVANVNASNGQTTTTNFSLFPFCAVFSDDMETAGVAWTATGNWGRTSSSSNGGSFSWTDSPGGNYGNNQDVTLTSPAIDLSAVGAADLTFAQRCLTEATYDFCIVEVSDDGVNWNQVSREDEASGGSWGTQTVDISAVAGSATAQVRFRLTTDVTVTRDGFYVDDVSVRAAGAQCVTVVDTDGDGVFDNQDNCTLLANASQLDVDGDGYGNACDADFNNDNVTNFLDISEFASDFQTSGVLETDMNGDGSVNFIDLAVVRDFYLSPPGPSGLVQP
ncbi:MAG: M14 family zinc carboxypeptidase [Gammaproteobacteria bacterium]